MLIAHVPGRCQHRIIKDVKDYIETHFGDVDGWVTTQIEASINTLKTANSKA